MSHIYQQGIIFHVDDSKLFTTTAWDAILSETAACDSINID